MHNIELMPLKQLQTSQNTGVDKGIISMENSKIL
jgi:hypothetical protein